MLAGMSTAWFPNYHRLKRLRRKIGASPAPVSPIEPRPKSQLRTDVAEVFAKTIGTEPANSDVHYLAEAHSGRS